MQTAKSSSLPLPFEMNIRKRNIFLGLGVTLLIVGLFCGRLLFFYHPTLVAKVKILRRDDEHWLYGGVGGGNGTLGCSSDLFLEQYSSLSFKCGKTTKFAEWIYVFSSEKEAYACPNGVFSFTQCLKCDECMLKLDRLKELDVSAQNE